MSTGVATGLSASATLLAILVVCILGWSKRKYGFSLKFWGPAAAGSHGKTRGLRNWFLTAILLIVAAIAISFAELPSVHDAVSWSQANGALLVIAFVVLLLIALVWRPKNRKGILLTVVLAVMVLGSVHFLEHPGALQDLRKRVIELLQPKIVLLEEPKPDCQNFTLQRQSCRFGPDANTRIVYVTRRGYNICVWPSPGPNMGFRVEVMRDGSGITSIRFHSEDGLWHTVEYRYSQGPPGASCGDP